MSIQDVLVAMLWKSRRVSVFKRCCHALGCYVYSLTLLVALKCNILWFTSGLNQNVNFFCDFFDPAMVCLVT